MADWDEQVHDIYRQIQDLPYQARKHLWDILKAAFPGILDDTDPAPLEAWDDSANRFGCKEAELLHFLCYNGKASEKKILRLLWPAEWPAKAHVARTEKILRERLRKMEQRIRSKLLRLKSDWVLYRPRPRHLELVRSEDWDP